jgi:hypothetical protein
MLSLFNILEHQFDVIDEKLNSWENKSKHYE